MLTVVHPALANPGSTPGHICSYEVESYCCIQRIKEIQPVCCLRMLFKMVLNLNAVRYCTEGLAMLCILQTMLASSRRWWNNFRIHTTSSFNELMWTCVSWMSASSLLPHQVISYSFLLAVSLTGFSIVFIRTDVSNSDKLNRKQLESTNVKRFVNITATAAVIMHLV